MSSLPSEVLHEIFIQLPLEQRLESMLVCRQWYHALSRRSLLYNVQIGSQSRLNNFKNMIHHFGSRALQVETLNILGDFEQPFDNRELCSMFPNLRVFTCDKNFYNTSEESVFNQPFEPMLPDSKLEAIVEDGECELARQLIMTGSCSTLRELELKLYDFDDPRQDIFTHLKNIPVLKNLALTHCNIGIQDCETFHTNIPTLEFLSLEFIFLEPGELPENITPAISITQFRMEYNYVLNLEEYPNWYIYMAKKYINLEILSCNDFVLDDAGLDLTTIIYRDGIIPMYKNIGKRVDYFYATNVPTELQVFNQLDDIGCRFLSCFISNNRTRPIFSQFAHSKQAMYVEELEIENTIIASPSLFQSMICLTELNIEMGGGKDCWPINLTEYLNAFPPTLSKFAVKCTEIETSGLPAGPSDIKILSIDCKNLSEELVTIISDFFPELYDLCLKGGVKENMTIDLSTKVFLNLSVETYFEEVPHGFSVSAYGSPVEYYAGKQPPRNLSSAILEPVTAEELHNRVTIEINYGFAKKIRVSTEKSPHRFLK